MTCLARLRAIHRDARDAYAVIAAFWGRDDRPDSGDDFEKMLAADDLAESALHALADELVNPPPFDDATRMAAWRMGLLTVQGLLRVHEAHDWPDAVSLASDVYTLADSLVVLLGDDDG